MEQSDSGILGADSGDGKQKMAALTAENEN